MILFSHLYCLRNTIWLYFKLWGHILSGLLILFFQENSEFPMMGSVLSLVFDDPLFKIQMLAKTQLAKGGKFDGGCFFS